jgi:hypothetical protein
MGVEILAKEMVRARALLAKGCGRRSSRVSDDFNKDGPEFVGVDQVDEVDEA